jgi:release factor H-coupled RctB family protein
VLEDGADQSVASDALRVAGLEGVMSPAGLGTIGGGNHFCEVQVVDEIMSPHTAVAIGLTKGDLCLLVHSGSRSLGAGIFTGLEARWSSGYPTGSPEAEDYLALHDRALRWARLNRRLIAEAAANALRTDLELICDAVHNHLAPHRGGWLHRKGAASPDLSLGAKAPGLAPLAGSRESLSFLLSAEDIPEHALGSLSHGAGRRYDRGSMHGRIRKTRSGLARMEKTRLGGQVICEDKDLMIEEAGHAYKDAGQVAADLEAFGVAQRVAALAPVITFKTARKGGRS